MKLSYHSRTCFSLILANVLTVFEVMPVCAAGGQLDQRGAERRRSTGGSLQRSDYSSGRGGSGRRGQVCVTHPPHHSSMSICRFLSFPLFLSRSLTFLLCCGIVTAPPPPAVILLLPFLSSVWLCGFLIFPAACLYAVLSLFFFFFFFKERKKADAD